MMNLRCLAVLCALLMPFSAALGAFTLNMGTVTTDGLVNQIDVLPGSSINVVVYVMDDVSQELGAGQFQLRVGAIAPTTLGDYFSLTAVSFVDPWSNKPADRVVPTLPVTLNSANSYTTRVIGTLMDEVICSSIGDFAVITVSVSPSAVPGTYELTGVKNYFSDPEFNTDIIAATGTGLTVNVLCNTGDCMTPPTVSWQSVKTHAGAGERAIILTPDKVEPRRGDLKIRATFSHAMQIPTDVDSYLTLIDDATSTPLAHGPATMTATALELTVAKEVANNKRLRLTLNNGNNKFKRADGAKVALSDSSITIRCLVGDVTGETGSGNGSVNMTDMGMVRQKMGQTVDDASCIYDLNLSGSITISDMAVVKLNLSATLP